MHGSMSKLSVIRYLYRAVQRVIVVVAESDRTQTHGLGDQREEWAIWFRFGICSVIAKSSLDIARIQRHWWYVYRPEIVSMTKREL